MTKGRHRWFTIPKRESAKTFLTLTQLIAGMVVIAGIIVGVCIAPDITAKILIACVLGFWLAFVGLKVRVASASRNFSHETLQLPRVDDPTLPTYTILLPTYDEAEMIPSLIQAIRNLRYPKDKVQILGLCEEEDIATIAAYEKLGVQVVIAPETKGVPHTKPNGLNFGLAVATGDLCVVYDAEDKPEPNQLLKVVAKFRSERPDVAVVQARLAFNNEKSSWISRFYWVEYVVHFEWMLSGLAQLEMVPPLGGTSNHFVTAYLKRVAFSPERMPFQDTRMYIGAWDLYNVTEDADLAGAFFAAHYRIVFADSVTYEEAPSKTGVAFKQRMRWLKGYAYTGIVYTRHPFRYMKAMGLRNYFGYILLMLGTPLTMLLSPVFWSMTIVYFLTRTTVIEELFPLPLFYTAVALALAGNLMLFYQQVVACLHRESYGTVKYMLWTPVWLIFTSAVAYVAIIELLIPSKRHFWHKTNHIKEHLKSLAHEQVRLEQYNEKAPALLVD